MVDKSYPIIQYATNRFQHPSQIATTGLYCRPLDPYSILPRPQTEPLSDCVGQAKRDRESSDIAGIGLSSWSPFEADRNLESAQQPTRGSKHKHP